MNPKVSINLCCYNSEKYLCETLDSIVNQTYKRWELIIINDGSTDATEHIIDEYIKQGYPIIYHYQENKGLAYSRNEALKRSHGEYIAFIDHDDVWLPEKLEKQVSILEDHLEADLLYSNYYLKKDNYQMLAFLKNQPQGCVFERFLYHYPVAILTTIIRKKAVDSLDSLFDENLNLSEDFDLFLRILHKSKAIYHDYPVAVYRVHSGMSTIKFMDKWSNEMEYIIKKFGSLYLNFEKDYSDALNKRKLDLKYSCAKMYMKRDDSVSARREIRPIKFMNLKYFLLYVFSYMPTRLWGFISLHFIRNPF